MNANPDIFARASPLGHHDPPAPPRPPTHQNIEPQGGDRRLNKRLTPRWGSAAGADPVRNLGLIYAIPDTHPQTRALSARQLTTGHRHAVPTRESQSDESSLPSRRPPSPSVPTTMKPKHPHPHALLDTRIHLRSCRREPP
jgi:hypothetical protein